MNKNILIAMQLLFALAVMASCTHKTVKNIVGADRDGHGCIASAGYCWSEARRDCIRLWETGLLALSDSDKLYVVFAPDSQKAEIFHDEKTVMCSRDGKKTMWLSKDKSSWISSDGREIMVSLKGNEFYGDCE